MRYYIIVCILCLKVGILSAQSYTYLTVEDFLNAVSVHPEIIRQTDDITLAQFNVEIARVSPDPVLGFGNASGDISGINMPQQLFIGIEHTVEMGRKRMHRVNYAKQQIAVAREEHTVFVNTFKRDALLAFQECWMLEQQIRELEQHINNIQEVIVLDSTQAIKRQLVQYENEILLNNLRENYIGILEELQALVQHVYQTQLVAPDTCVWSDSNTGEEIAIDQHYKISSNKAMLDLVHKEIALAASNRTPDISFTLGNNFITQSTNPGAPSPAYNAITAMVSIPLKISNIGKAERKRDAYRLQLARQEEASILDVATEEIMQLLATIEKKSLSINQIMELIYQQEKLIALMRAQKSALLLYEFEQLRDYHEMRWKMYEELTNSKAELYLLTGMLCE